MSDSNLRLHKTKNTNLTVSQTVLYSFGFDTFSIIVSHLLSFPLLLLTTLLLLSTLAFLVHFPSLKMFTI